jgi:hypothetical protein
MLRPARDLNGFDIQATDGDIGHVDQLLFDDHKWTVRYLVADTGGWLSGRQVLISPIALRAPDWDGKRLPVALTRLQVENSPDIDTDRPVSRQHEIDYFTYYGWPYYWGGPGIWGAGTYPGFLVTPSTVTLGEAESNGPAEEQGDPHLHSTRAVTGYQVEARDGSIGHVDDFILDDESWAIRYLVVDAGSWWAGRKVLIPPEWLERVSWPEETVAVDLDRETIRHGPWWEPAVPIDAEYEQRLSGYYGHPSPAREKGRAQRLVSADAERP